MTRSLGIDYGEKRVGVAISDPEGRVAVALPTLTRSNDRQVAARIRELVHEEAVERIFLGEPRNVDGRRGEAAERVRSFAKRLRGATGLVPRLVDEALTSHEAERQLRQAGVDPRKHPERIDALAARLLLQEALDAEGKAP